MNSASTEDTDLHALSEAELDEVTGGLTEGDVLKMVKAVETVAAVIRSLTSTGPQV